jgi:Domain of unknown function (DUF2017)
VSDAWFHEGADDQWSPDLPADARVELHATIDRLVELLDDPDAPPLRIELADGTGYDLDDLREIAEDSAALIRTVLRLPVLDADVLGQLIAAATNLQIIAVTLAETLAAQGSGEEDEAMGLSAVISQLLQRALSALDRSITPAGDGRFRLRWSDADRALVRTLSEELDAVLEGDDDALVRLFPPAYGTDETRSREYAALARTELVESRRAALATVEQALDNPELTEDELNALMRAVNDLRLVLGTQLDVSEEDTRRRDPDDPDAARWAAYERLTRMLGQIVGALSSSA